MYERGHVCVIDDEMAFLEGFSRLLEWRGYRVAIYMNADKAFEDIQRGGVNFDVIVADVKMPGLTGLGLVRKMKEARCEKPVVVMSARPDSDVMNAAKELGVDGLVRKPFKPDEMFSVLDKAIKNGKAKSAPSINSISSQAEELMEYALII